MGKKASAKKGTISMPALDTPNLPALRDRLVETEQEAKNVAKMIQELNAELAWLVHNTNELETANKSLEATDAGIEEATSGPEKDELKETKKPWEERKKLAELALAPERIEITIGKCDGAGKLLGEIKKSLREIASSDPVIAPRREK